MAYNPYGFYNPYQQQQKPINPRDLADQFAKSQQQYMNAYNQYQQAAQNIKTPPIANPNAGVPNAAPNPSTATQNSLSTFNGIYVDSYEDVKKAPVALDMANTHLKLYMKWHETVKTLVTEKQNKDPNIPQSMLDMWKYEHKKLQEIYDEYKYKLATVTTM